MFIVMLLKDGRGGRSSLTFPKRDSISCTNGKEKLFFSLSTFSTGWVLPAPAGCVGRPRGAL